MSSNRGERKPRVAINGESFNQIKRLLGRKSKAELMEITSLSKNALNEAIRRIETYDGEGEATFEKLYKKSGRKKKDKNQIHSELRSVLGNDNSLTQKGCANKLSMSLSLAQISREVKAAGLSRKRLKKKSNVLLTEDSKTKRLEFCSELLGMRARTIYFLDESGFNLHTLVNYGYSPLNQDAVLYQPRSKGRNISLCALISINKVECSMVKEGAFNREMFKTFLEKCNERGLFTDEPILVMDNVRFHHCAEIKEYLASKGVQVIYLPPYSPDLNPIENIFSWIKGKLDLIRPRAVTQEDLKEKIINIVESVSDCVGYYSHFWNYIHQINNRQV